MDNKKNLANFIQQVSPMADSTAYDIAAHFHPIELNKNDFLLKHGHIANNYFFLETGFMRAFTFDTEGNEVTTNIYGANTIVFEAASFIKRTPTKENFQALTNCTGWAIKHDPFQLLFHSIKAFREFGRANLVNGFVTLKERTLAMINLTAEQRYEHLLQTRPELLQNIPLKYIASFLGLPIHL